MWDQRQYINGKWCWDRLFMQFDWQCLLPSAMHVCYCSNVKVYWNIKSLNWPWPDSEETQIFEVILAFNSYMCHVNLSISARSFTCAAGYAVGGISHKYRTSQSVYQTIWILCSIRSYMNHHNIMCHTFAWFKNRSRAMIQDS